MTTTTYIVNSNATTKQKIRKIKRRRNVWQKIKQLNPLNWFNNFSDIEINMEEFSTKKTTQKIN
jgi:hypothetical protein